MCAKIEPVVTCAGVCWRRHEREGRHRRLLKLRREKTGAAGAAEEPVRRARDPGAPG